MNLAHVHIILNHVPALGSVVTLGLFIVALARGHEMLKRVSLGLFSFLALLTIPVYVTGKVAQATIVDNPLVSQVLIVPHEDAALQAFMMMMLTGAFAWFGLWQFRRIARFAAWNLGIVLLLGALTVVFMVQAGTMGGAIRHDEIRSGDEVTPAVGLLTAASVGAFVNDSTWIWPAAEVLHFVGLSLLFGVVALINLRMLGAMKEASFAAFHRLLPWGVLGSAVNTVTGMMFFIALPDQYTDNIAFFWKIGLMTLAGLDLLYVTAFDQPWAVGPGVDAPVSEKAIAASAIALWIGVIYFGRMLPFLGFAF